ncbi:hypothetical protein TNCV_2027321 [Trichonephila clavipes]|nr:hypothetical protein TNCV_2027321 [Trichonephila clavipes]
MLVEAHPRKSDEGVIEDESSASRGSVYQSSNLEENRHRLDHSQGFRSSKSRKRCGESKVTKEANSRPSRRAVKVQGGPIWSTREIFRRPSSHNQCGHSKQQGRPIPEQRNGRSSPHIPGQHSRQQDHQEPNGCSASWRSESLEIHIGDVKVRRKEL